MVRVRSQWSVVRSRQSGLFSYGPLPTDYRLSRFRRLAGHHFFRRDLHGLLRRLLDDAEEAVVLRFAERAALGDFHRVALASLVLFVVGVQDAAALEVLAVLRVLGLIVDLHADRLVA